MFDNLASASAQIKAGSVLALAVTSQRRAASLPLLPSVAEMGAGYGLRGFDVSTWFGVFAPAGTPVGVLAALNQAVRSTLANPANAERMKSMGADSAGGDSAQFAAFVATEHAKYAAVVQAAKVRID